MILSFTLLTSFANSALATDKTFSPVIRSQVLYGSYEENLKGKELLVGMIWDVYVDEGKTTVRLEFHDGLGDKDGNHHRLKQKYLPVSELSPETLNLNGFSIGETVLTSDRGYCSKSYYNAKLQLDGRDCVRLEGKISQIFANGTVKVSFDDWSRYYGWVSITSLEKSSPGAVAASRQFVPSGGLIKTSLRYR